MLNFQFLLQKLLFFILFYLFISKMNKKTKEKKEKKAKKSKKEYQQDKFYSKILNNQKILQRWLSI